MHGNCCGEPESLGRSVVRVGWSERGPGCLVRNPKRPRVMAGFAQHRAGGNRWILRLHKTREPSATLEASTRRTAWSLAVLS
jgi:hypothetical protein